MVSGFDERVSGWKWFVCISMQMSDDNKWITVSVISYTIYKHGGDM